MIFSLLTFAQKNKSWTLIDKDRIDYNEPTRKQALPSQYSIFEFDYEAFSNQLKNVPIEIFLMEYQV